MPGRDEEQRRADLDWLAGGSTQSTGRPDPAPTGQPQGTFPDPGTPPQQAPVQAPKARIPVGARTTQRPGAAPATAPTPLARTAGAGSPPGGARIRRPRGRLPRVLGIALLTWLLFLTGTSLRAWAGIATVDNTPEGDRPARQSGTAILLVGTDSREGLSQEEKDTLGTGDASGSRTDTMLIYFIPRFGRPALISLPRDSYLSIPGHKKNKLNAAYAFGGPELLTRTIEQNTGLRIDGYLEVGFAGFSGVIEALGGIQMCLDAPMADTAANIDLPAGCQTLTGPEALGYVRMRKSDPRGDIGRAERQREMIAAVADEAVSPLTLVNPVRWWQLTSAVSDSLRRGEDTGVLGELLPAARGAFSFARGTAISLVVPIANPNATTSAGSSVLWDEQKSAELFGQLARGSTADLARFAS